MPNTLLSADHHFFHQKIIMEGPEFKNPRPFKTIEEHNEALVDNHNRVVRPTDICYLGGDLILNSSPETIEEMLRSTVGRLNGVLYFIPGNHDSHFKLTHYAKYFKKMEAYKEFRDCVLSHIPLHESQMDRFKFNIHGHVHSGTLPDPRYFNISMEAINYTPVSIEEIRKRFRSLS